MTSIAITPASLSVFLIAEGCLPVIFLPEAVAGQAPVPGTVLDPEQRQLIGLTTPGTTVGYRVGEVDVFFDMGGEHATVWFAGGDFASAPPMLDALLSNTFDVDDLTLRPATTAPGKTTVTQEIVIAPKTSSRAALLSVTFGGPAAQGADQMFFVRIYPQERVRPN